MKEDLVPRHRGIRFAGTAEPREGPFGSAQSLRQSSLRCGTRFVGTAKGPYLARKSLNARRERAESNVGHKPKGSVHGSYWYAR